MKKKYNVELSSDEALILFEFLARCNKEDQLEPLTIDKSEIRVLWGLECIFEKLLVEPLQDNYLELLEEARKRWRPED